MAMWKMAFASATLILVECKSIVRDDDMAKTMIGAHGQATTHEKASPHTHEHEETAKNSVAYVSSLGKTDPVDSLAVKGNDKNDHSSFQQVAYRDLSSLGKTDPVEPLPVQGQGQDDQSSFQQVAHSDLSSSAPARTNPEHMKGLKDIVEEEKKLEKAGVQLDEQQTQKMKQGITIGCYCCKREPPGSYNRAAKKVDEFLKDNDCCIVPWDVHRSGWTKAVSDHSGQAVGAAAVGGAAYGTAVGAVALGYAAAPAVASVGLVGGVVYLGVKQMMNIDGMCSDDCKCLYGRSCTSEEPYVESLYFSADRKLMYTLFPPARRPKTNYTLKICPEPARKKRT